VTTRRCTPVAHTAAVRVGLCLLLYAGASREARAADGSPEGLWHTVDDRTGQVRSIVRVRIDGGELRGHIEKILPRAGEEEDPVCTRCGGARRNQRVVGMEILGGCRRERDRWTGGRILDPENGKEYSSTVWLEQPDRLRGYWGPFHRTQTWQRVVGEEAQP